MEEKGLVKIHTDTGELTLSPAIVRKYLVNGNGAVTEQEIMMFLGLCRYQRLNPFLRQAYLVKYGTAPATIITGKEAFMQRAMKAKDCKGFKAGIIYSTDKAGGLDYTDGVLPPGCKLAGGWAEVHKEGWLFPLRVEVSFEEYVGKTKDGIPNKMWSEKPATMIRKVALVQALREAFPEDLTGMISPEEINTGSDLPNTPVPLDGRTIDVGEQQAAPDVPPPATTAPPEAEQAKEGRRRRNKFTVDSSVFGTPEITTCGATPDQLLRLHTILRAGSPEAAGKIKAYLESIGYKELSFLRADEAEHLTHNGDVPPTDSPSDPPPAPAEDSGPKVFCPKEEDHIFRSWCTSSCPTREADGWCSVLGETPPDGEEMI